MSQMQPEPDDLDYEPRFLPPEPDEMYDDTLWNERAWQPGYRPPGPRPPAGQPWPRPPFGSPGLPHPPPSPGKWPFWGYWGFRMLNAWRDIKFLRRLVADMQADMLLEAIKDGIVAPGPNSPVPGPGGGTGTGGIIVSPTSPANPAIGQLWYDTSTDQVKFWDGTTWVSLQAIKGVTDGSDAAPGQVGEYINGTSSISYAAYPNDTTVVVSPLILPAGDWDLWANMSTDGVTSGGGFWVDPKPTGLSNIMQGWTRFVAGTTGWEQLQVWALARGSFSAPTLLPFNVQITQSLDPILPAGTATLLVEARRRR